MCVLSYEESQKDRKKQKEREKNLRTNIRKDLFCFFAEWNRGVNSTMGDVCTDRQRDTHNNTIRG